MTGERKADPAKAEMFRNRLQKMYRHRSKLAKSHKVSCYRIYDHDIPEFPVCIEKYEAKVYVAEYRRNHAMDETEHERWLNMTLEIIGEVLNVSEEEMFVRQRQRKQGRTGQYQKLGSDREYFEVQEAGLKFLVNLVDYLDTGLFLDHRITRDMVRKESDRKQVLNLFCYTGSFSVYAASGGAAHVDSVDLSKTYLAWAEENFALNQLNDPSKYKFIHADAVEFLKQLPSSAYDIIILDPPTFSNSKRMDDFMDVQRDHVTMINQCLDGLKPGGVLFFSTNYRRFQLDAGSLHTTSVRDITKATTPFDFEGKLFRYCYRIAKD
jgi:23S rRNA (cytosine1962-C5)-methyltransferase